MLHGRAVIDLHNTRTHRDERIVHDNMLTNWIRDTQKPVTIYGGMTAPYGAFTRDAIFRGLLMFRNALTNDADDYLIPSPHVNPMTAHADNSTYAGTDTTRGSFNASQSSNVEGTITSVWDFTQEQGNGTISSLGLCRTVFGRVGNGSKDYDSVQGNKATFTDYYSRYSPLGTAREKYSNSVQVAKFYDATNGHVITMSVQSGRLLIKRNWSFFGAVNPLRSPFGTTPAFAITDDPEVESYDLTSVFGTASTCVGYAADDGKFWLMPSGNLNANATRTLVCFDLLAKTYTTQVITNNVGEALYFPAPSANGVGASFVIDDGIMYCVTNTGTKAAYINLSNNTDCGVIAAPSGSGSVQVGNSSPAVAIYKWGNLVIAGSHMFMLNNATYAYALHKGESWYLQLNRFFQLVYGSGQASVLGQNIGKWLTPVGGDFTTTNEASEYTSKLMIAPALVTKNNLDSAVTKTADMTMRVTYTVTDQAE